MLSRRGLGLSRAVLYLQSVVEYLHQPVPAERRWRDLVAYGRLCSITL